MKGLAQDSIVLFDHLLPGGPEDLKMSGRPFDIGEQERDRSGGENGFGHRRSLCRLFEAGSRLARRVGKAKPLADSVA
jgi:hypothetical protein